MLDSANGRLAMAEWGEVFVEALSSVYVLQRGEPSAVGYGLGVCENYLPWVCELRDGDSPCNFPCGVRCGGEMSSSGSALWGNIATTYNPQSKKVCQNDRYYIQVSFVVMATASRQGVRWFCAFWRYLARPRPDQLSICVFLLLPVVRTHPSRYRPPDRPCTPPTYPQPPSWSSRAAGLHPV